MSTNENLQLFNEYIKCPSKENKDKIFERNFKIVSDCVQKFFIRYTKFIPIDDMIDDGLFWLYDKFIDSYAKIVAQNFSGREPFGFYTFTKYNLQSNFLRKIKKICRHEAPLNIDDFQKNFSNDDNTSFALKYLADNTDQFSKSNDKIDFEKEVSTYLIYLKPTEEKVIYMHFFQDMSFGQIAAKMGTTKQNCNRAYKLAMCKLQKWVNNGITKEEIEKSKIYKFKPSEQLVEAAMPQLDQIERYLAMFLLKKMPMHEVAKQLGIDKYYCYALAAKLKAKLYYLNAELEEN